MKHDLEFHWQKVLTVKINCDKSYIKLNEFIEYHSYPSSSLDMIIKFANWSVNRNIQVYMYPYKKENIIMKIIFNLFIKFYKKVGIISKEVII